MISKLDCTYLTVDFHTSFNGLSGRVGFEVTEPVEIEFNHDNEDGSLKSYYKGEYLEFLEDIHYEFDGVFAYVKIIHQEQNIKFTETKYQCAILSTMDRFVEWAIEDILIEIHKQHGLNYIVEEE